MATHHRPIALRRTGTNRPNAGLCGLAACAAALLGACAPTGTGAAPDAARGRVPQPVPIADLAGYGMWMDAAQRVVNLALPIHEYEAIRTKRVAEGADAALLSRFVYEHFEDEFDFILFAFDPRQPWVGSDTLAGMNFGVRRVADGLGGPPRPDDRSFGSEGRLASVSFLRTPDLLRSGLALHEIVHTWGQSVLPTDKPRHWGYAGVGGQLGGWPRGALVHRRDSVFEPRGNRPDWRPRQWRPLGERAPPYADLELYLMGLLPPDSVAPIEIAIEPRALPGRGAAFTAARIDTITIDQIIAEHGERVPSWRDAQRAFRGIFVVVSALPLGDLELARWSDDVRRFTMASPDRGARAPNFREATGGRATLQLDELGSALRPVPRTEQCAVALADTLRALQRDVLAGFPRVHEFRAGRLPEGALEGYHFPHGFAVVRGVGLTLLNARAADPLPQTLFYVPADTAAERDWTDFSRPAGEYELVGWGYVVQDRTGTAQPPLRGCIPAEAWFAQPAGWHLTDGGVLPTPGAVSEPARPSGRNDIYFWRPRTLALRLWIDESGVPILARENPRAPERGLVLPRER